MNDVLPLGPPLPQALQAVAYHRDPLGVLRRARRRYGPVFTLRFPLKDPLVIAAVLQSLPAILHADPGRAHAAAERRLRDDPGEDLLAAMIASPPALSDDEIVDQLLIVLGAAQEPPGIALANVLYELADRPAVADRFVDDPSSRSAIVAEVLRLRP